MKRCWSFAAFLLLAGSGLAQTTPHVPGEIVVKMKPGYSTQVVNGPIAARILDSIPELGDISRIKLPGGWTVRQGLEYYRSQPSVEFAEPNFYRKYTYVPNDPMVPNQYSLTRMNVTGAWNLTKGDANVIVAVLDSGVDYTHPDLAGNVILGHDYVDDDEDPQDADNVGHGTHVAGIIGATMNNGIGIAGVGGFNKVLAIRIGGEEGPTDFSSAAGIREAADKGARVINMSYGGYYPSQTESAAVQYAWSKNVILFGAAGNAALDSTYYPGYPASFPQVISVGATDEFDRKAGFSDYGPEVDVAAPGVAVLSTTMKDDNDQYGYEAWDGTSMASPNAAAVAALMISRAGLGVTNTKVRSVMEKSTVYVGSWLRRGRVDAYRAVRDIIDPVGELTPVTSIKARPKQPPFQTFGTTVDAQVANDGKNFAVAAQSVTGTGMVADVVTVFGGIDNDLTKILSMKLNLRASALTGASGMYWVWNYSTNSWQFFNNFAINTAYSNLSLAIGGQTTNYANYVQNKQVRVMYRTILPSRLGARSYNLRTDYAALSVVEASVN